MSVNGGGNAGGGNGYHHSSHRSYSQSHSGGRDGFSTLPSGLETSKNGSPPKIYYSTERTFYAPPPAETGTRVIVEKEVREDAHIGFWKVKRVLL